MTQPTQNDGLSCSDCGKSPKNPPKLTPKGVPRTPIGWKHIGESYFCKACWASKYVMRAITLPVAGPLNADWKNFGADLRKAWTIATQLKNWAVNALAQRDHLRQPGMEKLPKMPTVYLYGLAADEFPWWGQLDKSGAIAILIAVERTYRARRYDVLWLSTATHPNFRYPQPWPMGQNFAVLLHEGRPSVRIRIGQTRYSLLLGSRKKANRRRRSPRDRILIAFDHLVKNPELVAEVVLFEKRANFGDHRSGLDSRGNSGGTPRHSRVMCKIVGWFPVTKRQDSEATLYVQTTSDALLVAFDEKKERIWTYHARHLNRVLELHRWHLGRIQEMSDDTKAERRKPRRDNRAFRDKVALWSETDRNRMRSICHEVSASVIAFAVRRKITRIEFDGRDKSFAESFPWFVFDGMIESKAQKEGIAFASVEAKEEKAGTARDHKEKELLSK